MIFSEDANSFSLTANPLKSKEQLNSGLWLVLVGVHETPPHIALVYSEKYYSLSAKKVDCGTSVERFFGVLERKQIPALFVRIQSDNFIAGKEPIPAIIAKNYNDHTLLGNSSQTCLSPIKQFFKENVSGEFETINYVYELLALAQNKNLLIECLSLYFEAAIAKSIITLPKYTMVQIRNRIDQLAQQTAH